MGFKEDVMEYINSDRRKSIEVILPNGKKQVIYFTPMTLGDWEKVNLVSGGAAGQMQIWTIIEKLEKEDGSKVFTAADKPFLEMLDASIITAITGELLKISTVQDIKKN